MYNFVWFWDCFYNFRFYGEKMKEEEIRKKLKLLNNKMFDPTLSDSEFITLSHIVRDYYQIATLK